MSPTARHGGNPGALPHVLDVSVTGSRAKTYNFLRDSAVLLVETSVSSISATFFFFFFSGQTRLVLVTN